MNALLFLLVVFLFMLVLSCPRTLVHEGKVIMYGRDTCGYTVKMKNLIKKSEYKHLFQYVEISKNPHILKKLNVDGVPAFEYKGKVVVGAMPVKDLLKKINVKI